MPQISPEKWDEIHALWLTTTISNREIADRFGVAESAVRKHGKAWGPRCGSATKRAIVQAAMAGGARDDAQCAPRTLATKAVQDAASVDIVVMERAADIQVKIMERCEHVLRLGEQGEDGVFVPTLIDPKDLKALSDASRAATETYRKIRALDDAGAFLLCQPISSAAAIDAATRAEKAGEW